MMLNEKAINELRDLRIALENGGGVVENANAVSWIKKYGLNTELTYYRLKDELRPCEIRELK